MPEIPPRKIRENPWDQHLEFLGEIPKSPKFFAFPTKPSGEGRVRRRPRDLGSALGRSPNPPGAILGEGMEFFWIPGKILGGKTQPRGSFWG